MVGKKYLNNNYFSITRDEFLFLVMCQGTEEFFDIEILEKWDTCKLEENMQSLRKKGYLIEDGEGLMSVNPLLDTWMYVVTHFQGYFEAISQQERRFMVFFYEESIVTLYMKDTIIELIWIPFIHLAIGQMVGILKMEDHRSWIFKSQFAKSEIIEEISLSSERFMDVINNVSNLLLELYGGVMRGIVE